MSSKKEIETKWYISTKPGLVISLPEGLVYKETTAGITRTKRNVAFRVQAGKMVKTSQKEIQEFLESSPAFKRKVIMRVPTPLEIAQQKKQAEEETQLAFYKDLVKKPGVTIDFAGMSDSNVRTVADSIGVETSDDDGKKLKKETIAKNIEALVFVKVEPDKADPEPEPEPEAEE